MNRSIARWWLALGLVCAWSCGDSDADRDEKREADNGSTHSHAKSDASVEDATVEDAHDAGDAGEPPLYVVSTGTNAGDDFIGYMATVPALEKGAKFDLEHAAEIGTGSFIFGREREGSVYVASLGEPTIVRWEVTSQGKFHEGPKVSFANLGLFSAYPAASAPLFSDTKSYFVDDQQDQIVIWNPERMQVIGSIPLGDEADGDLIPAPEAAVVVRDDLLLVTVGWRDMNDTTRYGDHVRVVVVDTKTDAIVHSTTDKRSVHAALSAQSSDATAYYTPYSLYAAYRQVGKGHGAASTLLRIGPNAREFDDDYAVDLSELVGGRPAGDLTLLDDDTALIRVWHPELVDKVDATNAADVVRSQAGFMWWRWELGAAKAQPIEHQEPASLGSSVFTIDGKTYFTSYLKESEKTTVVEITPEGEFVPSLEGPGQIVGAGVMRVR